MKKIFLIFLIILPFLVTNSVFAIPCSNDQTVVKNPDVLKSERVYLDGLYANVSRKTDVLAQLEEKKRLTPNKDEALDNQIATAKTELLKAKNESEEAVKAGCGATKANQEAAKAELARLENEAKNAFGLGVVPAFYEPISPLPIPTVTTNGYYRVDNLISGGFTFAMIIAVFLAVIMIIYHGLGYILSGDSFAGKKFETKRLQEIIIGLLVILCSVVILNTIDPNIVALNVDLSNPGAKVNPEAQKNASGGWGK